LGLHFKAIIERFSQRFTMFLDDGTPVRAIVNITFKEYKTVSDQLAELALESADRTTLRTIKEGDSLWYLAAENYGDSEQWRAIAEANDIENPRLLSAGRQIEIPPLE
jgi:nucleoid-associated protein YgaU